MSDDAPLLLPERTASRPPASTEEVDGVETIDTAVFDEIESASRSEIDPWSRGAPRPAPRVTSTISAAVETAPPAPRPGSQWSRPTSDRAAPGWFGEQLASVSTLPVAGAVPPVQTPWQPPAVTGNRAWLDVLAIAMALVGGLLALVGSFFQELQSGVGIVLVVLAAPVIEEVLKPSGIYLLQIKWPQALRSQLHTALLCAISGAVFGVIESLIYVKVFYPDSSDAFVLFRFTVTPLMHATASFIVGWGVTHALVDWANGKAPLPKSTRNAFLAGISLHAIYNTSTIILGVLGVLNFLDT